MRLRTTRLVFCAVLLLIRELWFVPMVSAAAPAVSSTSDPSHSTTPAVSPAALPEFAAEPQRRKTWSRFRLLPVSGHPGFLVYAPGLTDTFDLALYRDLGFTSVVVDVPWSSKADFGPADIMIRSADRLGLGALVRVHPGEPPSDRLLRVDPADADYTAAAEKYLMEVSRHFRDVKGVDALLLEDDAEQHLRLDDAGFRRYLASKYGGFAALDHSWAVNYTRFDQVTMDAASRQSLDEYDGLALPCLDVGEYRSGAYAELLARWQGAVRSGDPQRELIAGRQDLPRAAIQIPETYRGLVVAISGSASGISSLVNVDIGRRAGIMSVVVEPSATDLQDPSGLQSLLLSSVFHGAGGVAFPSWPEILANRRLLDLLKGMLHTLRSAAEQLKPSAASCAVLYEPLAPGAAEGGPAAPYGYMPQPADLEPGALLETLSRGTRYGGVDVLAVQDITAATLARYRVVFLPSVFVVPPNVSTALASYVRSGGIVVADLGLGLGRLGRLEAPWPEALATLFGMPATQPVQFGRYEHTPEGQKKGLFGGFSWYPLVPRPDLFSGLTDITARSFVSRPLAYTGPRAFAPTSEDLSVFGLSSTAGDGNRVAGVFVRRFGQGYALFATFRLWSQWDPASDLFTLFHEGLSGRFAQVALSGANPPGLQFSGTTDGGFELLQTSGGPAVTRLQLQGGLPLLTNCLIQVLPTDPPSGVAFALARPNLPVVCAPTSVTVLPQSGYITAAVDECDSRGVVLKICGLGSAVRPVENELHLVQGQPADATITIRSGAYPITAGSRHVAVITELGSSRPPHRVILQAGTDQTLTLVGQFSGAEVRISPILPGDESN